MSFLTLQIGAALAPKPIKIKPVIRRKTCVLLQPRHVPLHPGLDCFSSLLTIQTDVVGEMFEVNFVAVSAAIETEKQNHGAMHYRGKQDRAGWERGRRSKELTSCRFVSAENAVS
jgi:hypothetical protein